MGQRRMPIALLLGLFMVCIFAVPARAARAKTFVALLNGGQEMPPRDTNAFGIAFMTFDEKTKLLCYAITLSDGLASETAADFHGPAAPGQNAAVLFPITPVPGRQKTGCVGPIVSGSQRGALKKGQFYVNIRTEQFPDGEVRGQVLPTR